MPTICPDCYCTNPDTGAPVLTVRQIIVRISRASAAETGGLTACSPVRRMARAIYTGLGILMMIALLVAGSFQVKKYFATLEIKHSVICQLRT